MSNLFVYLTTYLKANLQFFALKDCLIAYNPYCQEFQIWIARFWRFTLLRTISSSPLVRLGLRRKILLKLRLKGAVATALEPGSTKMVTFWVLFRIVLLSSGLSWVACVCGPVSFSHCSIFTFLSFWKALMTRTIFTSSWEFSSHQQASAIRCLLDLKLRTQRPGLANQSNGGEVVPVCTHNRLLWNYLFLQNSHRPH